MERVLGNHWVVVWSDTSASLGFRPNERAETYALAMVLRFGLGNKIGDSCPVLYAR